MPAGQVGILFLSQSTPGDGSGNATQTPCPAGVNVAYTTTDPAIHGSGRGHAFHITTTAPVVAFDIWPYGGASSYVSSATLLLPTSVWNTNYVAVTAYAPESQGIGTADSNVSFVASQDQTTVTINPVVDIVGGAGAAKASKGAASMYVLNKGESIQFEQQADLSGSVVLADKPIGTWGGHWGMDVPMGTQNLDAAHQQIPPVSALGSEYVGVRYRTRTAGTEESVPWPDHGRRRRYEVELRAECARQRAEHPGPRAAGRVPTPPGPFVVKSQDSGHPFYLAAHMTGLGSPYSLGDPETVNVVPPQQFMSNYVFFTDPTYKETNLVVVRSKGGPAVSLGLRQRPARGLAARRHALRVHSGRRPGGGRQGRQLRQRAPRDDELRALRSHGVGLRHRRELRLPCGGGRPPDQRRRRTAGAAAIGALASAAGGAGRACSRGIGFGFTPERAPRAHAAPPRRWSRARPSQRVGHARDDVRRLNGHLEQRRRAGDAHDRPAQVALGPGQHALLPGAASPRFV